MHGVRCAAWWKSKSSFDQLPAMIRSGNLLLLTSSVKRWYLFSIYFLVFLHTLLIHQDQESELAMLRDTMEKNESTIFEVYEDKQRRWEDEIARLRKELQEQDDGSRKTRLSLQGQVSGY